MIWRHGFLNNNFFDTVELYVGQFADAFPAGLSEKCPGNWSVYCPSGHGKDLCAALLHERPEPRPVPDRVYQPVHHQRNGFLPGESA